MLRVISVCLVFGTAPLAVAAEPERREPFHQARFGVSISWGVWTILGKGESVIADDRLPAREYEKLLPLFKPAGFQADEWVGFVKASGAKYLVAPAKGPDGLCLFETKTTKYDVADVTPFAKDPLKLLSEAAEKQRLPMGVSFSLRDVHHPDARPGGDRARYMTDCLAQIDELATQYGDLFGVWLEGVDLTERGDRELAEIAARIRKHQPSALIVRVGGKVGEGVDVVSSPKGDAPNGHAFEKVGSMPPVVSGEGLNVRPIVADLLKTASRGGNYRLVIQPRADGLIPSDQVERLKELGNWFEKNGPGVYRTLAGPIPARPWGVSTRSKSGETVYLHVLDPGVPVTIPPEPKGFEAKLFHSTQTLNIVATPDGYKVELPEGLRTPNATVIAIRKK